MAANHPLLRRIHDIRAHAHRRHQCDFNELQREIDGLELEVAELIGRPCHCGQPDTTPATGTITATREDGTVSDTYTPGDTIYLTAGQFANTEGEPITGTVAGAWSASQGAITANPGNADEATLVGVPVGPVTVTFTTGSGLVLTYDAAVVDQTPATGVITGSATAPTNETPASA